MFVETVTLGPMFLYSEPFAFFYIILTFSNGFSSPSTNEPKKLELLQLSHQKVLCKKFNLRVYRNNVVRLLTLKLRWKHNNIVSDWDLKDRTGRYVWRSTFNLSTVEIVITWIIKTKMNWLHYVRIFSPISEAIVQYKRLKRCTFITRTLRSALFEFS